MARTLLVRGLIAGVLAGVLAFVFAKIFGEPQIDKAIAFEEMLAAAAGDPGEPEVVSRGVQSTLGLFTGTVVMGIALGSIYAIVFAWAYGRIGALGARATAALLALAAFLAITLVPSTKYPANPPTVGNPDTIDRRTLLFFAMIAISVLALLAAWRLWQQLAPRLGAWNGAIVAAIVFVAVIAVAELILPTVQETPRGFPADVLWHFRVASIGINATLWAALGLGFGALAERVLEPSAARRAAAPARA
ncbi:CbtA family protein [Conexibacter sp. JD483]|uniref:CbtA family protein n=1 Tax=unclassified Conexibacter TaxID=2627773 RepID=UPI0027280A0A|nr:MULTISPECIES: CbtA family protein [unclassified Conexibacter]MDO8189003.1 CbtA family protein [Conexibacter sp. CPCC 205706]MDO8201403.1 CbtA family protein [Conexibacter sp. CPCC 205762]MDR9371710.1 CbtA family protein [Conexibacter sp. JD483]